MAATLFSSPPHLPLFSTNLANNNNRNCQLISSSKRREKTHFVVACSSEPISAANIQRRDFVLFGTTASLLLPFRALGAEVESASDVKMALSVDDINAYSFLYPLVLPEKNFTFKWIQTRKPERYSSAAPLAPNARQRIVSEYVDISNNLVISVSIGPPNARFLTSTDKSTWKSKDVADSILSDKSALPVATDKRKLESSVLDTHSSVVDGEPYWYYEYLVRKSPTKAGQESNLYRHNVASTAERDGYLYSLNASTLSKQWDAMGPYLRQTVSSFRLLPPTESYVPPFKDPWRFW